MSWNFFVQSDIEFGRGAIEKLPEILKSYEAKKVMLVYDGGVRAAGIADIVTAKIADAGVEAVIFDGVIPNPTNEVVEKAAAIARNEEIALFVAVGGGSSIDLAKAVNVLMTNPGPIGQYGGMNMVKNPLLPLIAIPTTAGTSSEITNVSALIDTEKVIKYVIIDNKIVASKVICDPDFTRTMPASVTAATGMDAITHAAESYISNMATPLTKYNALAGIRLLHKYLPRAVKDGGDMEAREQMMLGCIITGFSFSNANLGFVHAIAHTLSAHFGLAHGMANAAVLPYVMAFNSETCPREMADLAEAVGLPLTGDPDKDRLLLSEELLKLTKELGIRTLSEQGITEADFEMLADDVLREPVLNFNPRQGITKEQIIGILRQAF